MDSYYLRLLDPATDAALFRESYSWRNKPKSHVQPDRMSFADFAGERNDQIVVGLFNGELQAVYLLHETEPACYQCHFTSQRKVPRKTLITAARQVASDFFAAGAVELHAWVTERNHPLRSFLESVGFTCVGEQQFSSCQSDTDDATLPASGATSARRFVKYVLRG